MKDFNFMLNSPNLAISQSSFSWWAAFLGFHKHIIFPFNEDINWWPVSPGVDDIDLFFDIDNISYKYTN